MILTVNGHTDLLTRAVIISLFSWRRADAGDDTEHPTGWWGDSYPVVQNDRTGSRLYLLRRTTLTPKTVTLARSYIEQALQWMQDDGVTDSMTIDLQRTGTDTLTAVITLYLHEGNTHCMTLNNIWSELNG